MNARRVHSVMAAGLQDPALIAAWRRDPELLRAHDVDPAAFDLDALWKFVGLTTKVRHNGIREELPLTFRLLHVTELAIDVFASYAARRAADELRWASTAEARARDFLAFLERWIDRERPPHVLLWDMARHEHALAVLARAATTPAAPALGRATRITGTSVPRRRDGLIVHAMHSDPRAVAMLLRERTPPVGQVVLAPCCMCYWRDRSEAAIVQLDAAALDLLELVDGERRALDIDHGLGGGRRARASFLRMLGELVELGVLAI